MTELVYKLKLPNFSNIKLDSYTIPNNFVGNFAYMQYNPINVIKSEWLTINGIYFDGLLMFYKGNGYIGNIHSDTGHLPRLEWGINWIHGGKGTMEYWYDCSTFRRVTRKDMLNNTMTEFFTDLPPSKTYNMEEGAYLVNATETHRATGNSNRYAYSLRPSSKVRYGSWADVVETFKNLIES